MKLATPAAALAACAVCAASDSSPPERSFADFIPSRHGFGFVNHFTGSSLPGPLILLHDALDAPDEFGLCGGMSFAAADFYLAGRAVPAQSSPPSRGQPLYDFIYRRQADSLGERLSYAAKFSRWMDLPDAGPVSAGRATLGELDAILGVIDRGAAAHLGLVYISAAQTREPWHNHQVLAFAAESRPESGGGLCALSLHIYDPNYPGNDAVRIDIALSLDGFERIGHDRSPVLSAVCTQVIPPFADRPARTRNIRGLFPMPYEPQVPPPGL